MQLYEQSHSQFLMSRNLVTSKQSTGLLTQQHTSYIQQLKKISSTKQMNTQNLQQLYQEVSQNILQLERDNQSYLVQIFSQSEFFLLLESLTSTNLMNEVVIHTSLQFLCILVQNLRQRDNVIIIISNHHVNCLIANVIQNQQITILRSENTREQLFSYLKSIILYINSVSVVKQMYNSSQILFESLYQYLQLPIQNDYAEMIELCLQFFQKACMTGYSLVSNSDDDLKYIQDNYSNEQKNLNLDAYNQFLNNYLFDNNKYFNIFSMVVNIIINNCLVLSELNQGSKQNFQEKIAQKCQQDVIDKIGYLVSYLSEEQIYGTIITDQLQQKLDELQQSGEQQYQEQVQQQLDILTTKQEKLKENLNKNQIYKLIQKILINRLKEQLIYPILIQSIQYHTNKNSLHIYNQNDSGVFLNQINYSFEIVHTSLKVFPPLYLKQIKINPPQNKQQQDNKMVAAIAQIVNKQTKIIDIYVSLNTINILFTTFLQCSCQDIFNYIIFENNGQIFSSEITGINFLVNQDTVTVNQQIQHLFNQFSIEKEYYSKQTLNTKQQNFCSIIQHLLTNEKFVNKINILTQLFILICYNFNILNKNQQMFQVLKQVLPALIKNIQNSNSQYTIWLSKLIMNIKIDDDLHQLSIDNLKLMQQTIKSIEQINSNINNQKTAYLQEQFVNSQVQAMMVEQQKLLQQQTEKEYEQSYDTIILAILKNCNDECKAPSNMQITLKIIKWLLEAL